MIKYFAFLAFLVLGFAAVYMGGLNQDEGWYLYAANLVSEGRVPYADFAYTQGPVMPYVYALFVSIWAKFGLLGARLFTLFIGALGIFLAALTAHRFAESEKKDSAALLVFLALAVNLYHLYFLAIPKTYALSSLFILLGFYVFSFARHYWLVGILFALAAGTRLSLGILLPVMGIYLYLKRDTKAFASFAFGGGLAILLIYVPFLLLYGDAFSNLVLFHTSREGMGLMGKIGSVSRIVRYYLPVFVLMGLGDFKRTRIILLCFAAVFILQLLAPVPYDDYQVPVMALLAIFAAINVKSEKAEILTFLVAAFLSFGSPLLEKWTTDGQDRFWTIKKEKTELQQLRDVAREIETLDPGGSKLFTEDLYLAIETNRKVPRGYEMGPFSEVSFGFEPPEIAALSGYTFAIKVPEGSELPLEEQLLYWTKVKEDYEPVKKIERFGQNATPLLILRKKQ